MSGKNGSPCHVDVQTQIVQCRSYINCFKPTGYVLHQQFNIQELYVLLYTRIYLRINIGLCHMHLKLIGFYKEVEKCLKRGTNWAFKLLVTRCISKFKIQQLYALTTQYLCVV
jgi:hypothetical protein